MVASIALIGVGLPLGVTAVVDAVDDPGDGSEVLAQSQQLLEAVEARDGDAITALLGDEHDLMAPDESHARQPQATDLIAGDEAAAEAIDLDLSWTPSELDHSADGEPLTSSTAMVATTVTYGFTVAGERSEASYRLRLAWFRDGELVKGDWGLHHVVTPDLDTFDSTYAPEPFEGTEQDPGAAAFGVGDCDPSWVSMSQALDLYDEPGSPVCLPDGVVPSTFAPEVRAELELPAGERSFGFEVVQTQLTQVVWSDHLPLSEWLLDLDGREYVAVVLGAQDGTGRLVAVVPTS